MELPTTEQLMATLSQEEREDVAVLIDLLGEGDSLSAAMIMSLAMANPDARVREDARRALGRIANDGVVERIGQQLHRGDDSNRMMAGLALAGIGGDHATAILTAALGDDHADTNSAAVLALAVAEGSADPAGLLEAAFKGDVFSGMAASATIARGDPTAVVAELVERLGSPEKADRARARGMLRLLAPSCAAVILADALESDDSVRRACAIAGLGHAGSGEGLGR